MPLCAAALVLHLAASGAEASGIQLGTTKTPAADSASDAPGGGGGPGRSAELEKAVRSSKIALEHAGEVIVLLNTGKDDVSLYQEMMRLRGPKVVSAFSTAEFTAERAGAPSEAVKAFEKATRTFQDEWFRAVSVLRGPGAPADAAEARRRAEEASKLAFSAVHAAASALESLSGPRKAGPGEGKAAEPGPVPASALTAGVEALRAAATGPGAAGRLDALYGERPKGDEGPLPPGSSAAARSPAAADRPQAPAGLTDGFPTQNIDEPRFDVQAPQPPKELPPLKRASLELQRSALAALGEVGPLGDWAQARLRQVNAQLDGSPAEVPKAPREFTTPDGRALSASEVADAFFKDKCERGAKVDPGRATTDFLVEAVTQRGHYETDPETFWETLRRGKIKDGEALRWNEDTPRNAVLPGIGPVTASYAGWADLDHFSQGVSLSNAPWSEGPALVLRQVGLKVPPSWMYGSEGTWNGGLVSEALARGMNNFWTYGKKLGVVRGSVPDERQHAAGHDGVKYAADLRRQMAEGKDFCGAVAVVAQR